jgi:hypothetical protein
VIPQQILIVLIRLFAIIWSLHVLGQIAAGVVLERIGVAGEALAIWVLVAAQFVACAFLWFFPATLASKLLRSGNVPVSSTAVPVSEWQALALVTVGVFALTRAIPNASYWAIMLTTGSPLEPNDADLGFEQKVSAFAALLELLIGLWLVLGSAGIRSAIFRLRGAGLPADRNAS